MSLAGCTNSYEDYNQDPYGVSKKETERDAYSLGAAMIKLAKLGCSNGCQY